VIFPAGWIEPAGLFLWQMLPAGPKHDLLVR
jgi:hypothetical protein